MSTSPCTRRRPRCGCRHTAAGAAPPPSRCAGPVTVRRAWSSSKSMKYSPGSMVTTKPGSSRRVSRRYGCPAGRGISSRPDSSRARPATSCTCRPSRWPMPCGKKMPETPDGDRALGIAANDHAAAAEQVGDQPMRLAGGCRGNRDRAARPRTVATAAHPSRRAVRETVASAPARAACVRVMSLA